MIQRKVLDPLAMKIVAGLVRKGEEVFVEEEAKKIVIRTPGDLIRAKKKEKVLV